MDADAKTETECLPVCGLSFFSAAAADAETDSAETDSEMTAACGSSFFSAAAAGSETTAADADPSGRLLRRSNQFADSVLSAISRYIQKPYSSS